MKDPCRWWCLFLVILFSCMAGWMASDAVFITPALWVLMPVCLLMIGAMIALLHHMDTHPDQF